MELFPILDVISLSIFLILSAFFSSSETIFTAVNQIKLESIVKENKSKAIQLKKIYSNPQKLLTGILVGNNIANVAATALATAVLLELLNSLGYTSIALTMSIITVTVTVFLLIFGEITPKTLALINPEKLACIYAKPIMFWLFLSSPIILIFQFFTTQFSKLFGVEFKNSNALLSLEELKTMLDLSRKEGVLEKEKKDMLQSVFDISETVVREIMTPRTDTICISVASNVQEAIELIIEKGHSRIPVYESKIDNTVGMIYAKDMLKIPKTETSENIRKYMRKAVFIPESKNIEELLQQMKKTRFHLAIVVDEYGGMAGIVTLEDIVEEIIGEIQDEYDLEEKPMVSKLQNNQFIVDAAMNIKELGEEIEFEFPESDDYDTLGGFVLSLIGEFPNRGTTVSYKNLDITIKEIRKHRIISIMIRKNIIVETEENDS